MPRWMTKTITVCWILALLFTGIALVCTGISLIYLVAAR